MPLQHVVEVPEVLDVVYYHLRLAASRCVDGNVSGPENLVEGSLAEVDVVNLAEHYRNLFFVKYP